MRLLAVERLISFEKTTFLESCVIWEMPESGFLPLRIAKNSPAAGSSAAKIEIAILYSGFSLEFLAVEELFKSYRRGWQILGILEGTYFLPLNIIKLSLLYGIGIETWTLSFAWLREAMVYM